MVEHETIIDGPFLSYWQIIGNSVQGASHVKGNIPNQDNIDWKFITPNRPPFIISISDGHGSKNCFRSDKGSLLAVRAMMDLFTEFNHSYCSIDNLTLVKRTAIETLPSMVISKWRLLVDQDILSNPFSPDELQKIGVNEMVEEAEPINKYVVYGATLLSVMVFPNFIIYLQLGDGDILVLSQSGEVIRPVPQDSRLIANETTSLCLPNAQKEVVVVFQTIIDNPPRMIMLSTDGYSNSFSDNDFLNIAREYAELIKSEGIEKVRESLNTWLIETTREGSGDDITLGIIYCNSQSS